MKLPFIFKNNTSNIGADTKSSASSSWPWPSCSQPRTLSFRAGCADVFKTVSSAPESWFTNSSESASFSTASTDEDAGGGGGDMTETVIRGLRSERLFFEPGETNSILEEGKGVGGGGETVPFKESLVLSMESRDPYVDFRRSMEEMVEAHGLKEWENLEELLCWYLRVNGKHNHDYIVGAFVDLFVGLAIAAAPTTHDAPSTSKNVHHQPCDDDDDDDQDSPSSPLSFYTSSSLSSSSSLQVNDGDVGEIQEIEEEDDDDDDMMMDVLAV